MQAEPDDPAPPADLTGPPAAVRTARARPADRALPAHAPAHLPLGGWYALPQAHWLGGNELYLLRGGDEYFPALVHAIDNARFEIWFATYIFHNDAAAEHVAGALAAAARRGVRVHVVVDGFGSHRALPKLQQWLLPSGVALVVFRPLERWWNYLQPGQMRRLHHKLCVVDSSRAFVGGINVIDDRNDLHHGFGDAPRLDFAVELTGPVVAPIEQTTRAVWSRAAFGHDWRREVLALMRSSEPLQNARRLMRRMRLLPPESHELPDPTPVMAAFLVRDNLRQRRAIERGYIDAIRFATRRVDLISPYFYPGRSFRRALVKAARRGVKVRLLLQGKIDYRVAGLAARVLYDELLAEGVEIHEYTPAFLHAKTAIVDDDWCTVGSSNIDPLSLLLNLEANLVVRDLAFTGGLALEFERALHVSKQITVAPFRKGPSAVLGRGFVAWLAHWYLRMAGISGKY